jgi:hypothetical protein
MAGTAVDDVFHNGSAVLVELNRVIPTILGDIN